jgi:putative membrane protein
MPVTFLTSEVETMKTHLPVFTAACSAGFLGCVRRPVDGSAGDWHHMMGYGNYGGMFMWLILLILAGVIVYFIFERSRRSRTPGGAAGESPVDILKRRYASGEITREEFDRLKKEIER